MTEQRLATGVAGLDAMIGGGFLPGDTTLVAGSPGVGKTTLGLHFLATGVENGEPGVFVTFEYLPQQIYRDAQRRGWPLRQWEKEGKARLICTSPQVLLAQAGGKGSILDQVVREVHARRLVIDSMSQFEALPRNGTDLRQKISGLMNHLRMLQVTTLMTSEIAQIIGPAITLTPYGLEFMADNIIVLRYVELEGELQKALNVLKFRGGAHDRKYRVLELSEKGMSAKSGFTDVENITSGAARRTVAERLKRMV